MSEHVAACSCGQLSVRCNGEPVRISVCHCLACQRRTGSVFAAQARFHMKDAEISGRSTAFVRVSDEGRSITFHFCPQCGSTVYYRNEDQPDLIAIPTGAFADPSFPAPSFSVYESRKHGWVVPPQGPDIEHTD